ncbi:MAG: pirin family protein [Thiothrix sp.]|uniref:pirin family protein n=1 Tax=Thiothrix sp. TaxID=1032 RepID=UPI00260FA47F|nr:pirin family protein [Thiothrix sp.]MDD5394409.1 pirin family protein [Thiothrix sp.]
MAVKSLHGILRSRGSHWVGDGFPVRSMLSYDSGLEALQSPFLLLDYAGPHDFPPTERRLGVGAHPHRGFETVTIVYDGEVEHRDSSGAGGKIGKGDVQWMTAAGGVVHEEFHGREFAKQGGRFEMIQLWVNLPAKDKMNPPSYQGILDSQIPHAALPAQQGYVRVIAGTFAGQQGPARTHTPINVWDMRLNAGASLDVDVPEGHSCVLLVLQGSVTVNGQTPVQAAEIGLFEWAGDRIHLASNEAATVLLLTGEPLNEPVVGYGPFVMNTQQEIRQAIEDYRNGKMGRL